MSDQTIYLLYVWTEAPAEDQEAPPWRAVLEEPRAEQRWGFSDPGALVAFLERMSESANERMDE
jgi:hypothetical protein